MSATDAAFFAVLDYVEAQLPPPPPYVAALGFTRRVFVGECATARRPPPEAGEEVGSL